jgi:ABC-type Na+ efflux pump permease subunit
MPEALHLLRHPVFEREFFQFCRMRKWYLIRTGLVATLTVVVWFFFAQGSSDIATGNLDAVGRTLFAAACFTQMLFLVFVTPGLSADLVASERRTGNLEVLLSTPLRPGGILAGKMLSRVSLLLVIVASSFPAISVTLLFGGVRAEQVAGLFLVSTGLVLLLSGPSLLLSAMTDRTALAAALAYLIALIPVGILVIPGQGEAMIAGAVWNLAFPPLPPAVPVSPVKVGLIVVAGGLACMVLSLVLARARLRLDRSGRAQAISVVRRRPKRIGKAYDQSNPMLAWEARRVRGRSGLGPFGTVLFILIALEAVVFFLPEKALIKDGPTLHAAVVTAEAFIILLFTVLSGSTSVITDREQGTIELIRMTDLTPREVVQGKALGTALAAAPLMIVPIIHLVLHADFRPMSVVGAAFFLFLISLAICLCAADGVMNSIHARSVPRAILRSMWHFSWLTVFLPIFQFILPMLFWGEVEVDGGPQFSMLYPIYHAAAATLGQERDSLDIFGFVFWLFLLGIMAAALWALLSSGRFRTQHTVRRKRSPRLSDWRESWAKLTSQWDEED